ncbi:hypothetical protein SAMN06296036_114180 [Pseudobacteriovorax antillogorgiicola]|uniref:Uncharacterized protein n=1 Tax=Pseudobacteriovorax antillogorgiicola TaxID=1513793 RepID=A0A1Y6CCZ0_9BACT|nr:hypothetical protein EDD56_1154 [Pseudobacteriovorax antillogorgiicola]SMF48054.1 hypothetical protein SAMN06296036_114180 [Pseudobacteriovorax antillogorgiicola]
MISTTQFDPKLGYEDAVRQVLASSLFTNPTISDSDIQ